MSPMPIHRRLRMVAALGALALIVTARAAAQSEAAMILYRANLHSHTEYSDAYSLFWPEATSPATAYAYAHSRGLGALAVTDHGEMLNLNEWTLSKQAALNASASYWPFVGIHGFEWTATTYVPDTGHCNVFGSTARIGAYQTGQNTPADVFGSLNAFYAWLATDAEAVDASRSGAPMVVAQFNHPTAHDGSDHHNGYALAPDPRTRQAVALFEVGSWVQDPNNLFGIDYEGTASDNDTMDPRWSAEYWYRAALSAGWRVAPSNNGDNHLGGYVWHHNLGPPTCTGIYMAPPASGSALERQSSLLDALRARRTFGAEDRDAALLVTADAGVSPWPWWMGSAFGTPAGGLLTIRIRAADPSDDLKKVQLLRHDGIAVAEWTNHNARSFDQSVVLTDSDLASLPVTAQGEICLYTKVTEKDGQLLFGAPLWISRPQIGAELTDLTVFGSVGSVQYRAVLRRSDTEAGLAGNNVVFSVNGIPVGVVTTDTQGIATLDHRIPSAETYTLTAEFAGDSEAAPCWDSATIDAAAFTSLSTLDRTGTVTHVVTLRAYLKRLVDDTWLAGKTVDFSIDGTSVGSAVTNASGRADLNWTVTPGPAVRTIRAVFPGVEGLQSSFGQASLTAQVWATKMVGFDRTQRISGRTELKARLLRSDNVPIAGKNVDFLVDGTYVITRPSDAAGYARYPYYDVPDGAGSGARTILSVWAGNGGYLPVSKAATLTVQKALPYIWVMPRTIAQGDAVKLYAYVRRLYDYRKQEGKTVDFMVDGVLVQSVTTDGDGVARGLYQSAEPAGLYKIRCEFAGDAWLEAGAGESDLTIH